MDSCHGRPKCHGAGVMAVKIVQLDHWLPVAEVGRVFVEPGQGTVDGRRCAEPHAGANVVIAAFAVVTCPAGDARLDGNPVSW